MQKLQQTDASVKGTKPTEGLDEYIEQYDPNQDFAIFNVGNKAVGGTLTLKEKMNVADVNQSLASSLEDNEERKASNNEVATKIVNKVLLPQKIGKEKVDVTKMRLEDIPSDLPENQEI